MRRIFGMLLPPPLSHALCLRASKFEVELKFSILFRFIYKRLLIRYTVFMKWTIQGKVSRYYLYSIGRYVLESKRPNMIFVLFSLILMLDFRIQPYFFYLINYQLYSYTESKWYLVQIPEQLWRRSKTLVWWKSYNTFGIVSSIFNSSRKILSNGNQTPRKEIIVSTVVLSIKFNFKLRITPCTYMHTCHIVSII